ncbi:MAG: hypothetical protein RJB38_567 [Pseudomonadota bacterium]|jgi:hypothetical protein
MLPKVSKVGLTLGHWLASSTEEAQPPQEASESSASDGDLPQGAGFREPAPDPQWRQASSAPPSPQDPQPQSAEKDSENPIPTPPPSDQLESANWTALHDELLRHPISSRPQGLRKYRQASGTKRSVQRFKKGVVVDKAG